AARAVEPEGHVVVARWGWFYDVFARFDPVGAEEVLADGSELLLGGGVDDDDPGEGVVDEVAIVVGALKDGVDGDGDGADADRPEEGGDPAGAVEAADEDPFFAADTLGQEGAGGSVGEPGKVAVGDISGRGVDGDLGGAAGQIPLE